MMDVKDRSTAEALLSLLEWERHDDGVPGNSTSQFNLVSTVGSALDIITRIILAENIFYIQTDDSDRGRQSTGPLSYSRFSTLFPRYREDHDRRLRRAEANSHPPGFGGQTA